MLSVPFPSSPFGHNPREFEESSFVATASHMNPRTRKIKIPVATCGVFRGNIGSQNPPNPLFQRGDLKGNPEASYRESPVIETF